MGKKDDSEKKVEHHHTGSVVPEDEGLAQWVFKLWSRQEVPERVEVWQVFGKEKRDRGDMIFHEDFGPAKKLDDIEKATHFSNEVIAACQNDCDATPKRREAYFQIAVIDRNRRAVPLVRRVGPFRPQRNNVSLVHNSNVIGDLEDDDEDLSLRSLEHARLKTGYEEVRRGNYRNDRVLGELLLLMGSIIQEQRDETRMLRSEVRETYTRMQDAEDRRAQREIALEKERFKIGLMKEGVRAGRNLLPGLFAEARASSPATEEHSNGHNGHSSNGNNGSGGPAPQYGTSTERALVDNFLTDCEGEDGLMEKLFGEAEDQNGKLVLTKPGIFTPKQAHVLIGVRGGFLPPSALDPLMPGSGHEIAITPEQISAAMDAGVTDGMGMALIELKETRKRAQEAASETNNAPAK